MKVHVAFDGMDYDGSIVNMGIRDNTNDIVYIIGIRKDIQKTINKTVGEVVQIIVQERE